MFGNSARRIRELEKLVTTLQEDLKAALKREDATFFRGCRESDRANKMFRQATKLREENERLKARLKSFTDL